jgi:hypothetical protein
MARERERALLPVLYGMARVCLLGTRMFPKHAQGLRVWRLGLAVTSWCGAGCAEGLAGPEAASRSTRSARGDSRAHGHADADSARPSRQAPRRARSAAPDPTPTPLVRGILDAVLLQLLHPLQSLSPDERSRDLLQC